MGKTYEEVEEEYKKLRKKIEESIKKAGFFMEKKT